MSRRVSLKESLIKFLSCFIFSSAKRKAFRSKMNAIFNAENSNYEIDRKKYNIGEFSYIGESSAIKNPEKTKIGKYCSISHYVAIGLSEHPINTLTSHGFILHENCRLGKHQFHVPKENIVRMDNKSIEGITIENDVWIGYHATILNGITIHNGAVVAAGAVVTHDVPPYAIVGGVPAKVIKYRFDEKTINKLLELKWWDFPVDFVEKLPFSDIDKCIKILEENISLRENN